MSLSQLLSDDFLSLRAKSGLPIVRVVRSEARLVGAVGIHHVDLVGVIAVARKSDLLAVGRPSSKLIVCVVCGETCLVGAVGVHYVDVIVAIAVARKSDPVVSPLDLLTVATARRQPQRQHRRRTCPSVSPSTPVSRPQPETSSPNE